LLVSWLFLSVIGFPVAAVRAGLTSTITTMANIYFARGKFGSSLALGVFCHALLMPQGVLSLSAILSWSAYAIVSANSTKRGFMAVLWMQITMIMFCAGMFGAFSPLAILMNLVAIPLFPPLFVSAWLVLIPGPWQEPIIVVHGFAQDAILMAHDWALEQQLLWENIPTTIRVVMLTIACYNLLRVSWLSLEDEESDGGGKNNPNSG
jgi:predicted membrane metal-binding protein